MTFDQQAIPKCLDRLGKAAEALYRTRNGVTADVFRSAFTDYLLMTGSLLHALEAGSKDTPQGRQWWGGKKRLGRSDPLLRYMHQARNVEEHSKEYAALMKPGRLTIGGPIRPEEDNGGEHMSIAMDGRVLMDWQAAKPTLLPLVGERYNEHFAVPDSHMGRRLESQDPVAVAGVYLTYLEALVEEESSLS